MQISPYLSAASLCAFFFCALPQASGQTLYWDTNYTEPGSTNIRSTWSSDSRWATWSTNSAGTVPTQPWIPGATAVFSAGSNATGSFVVDPVVNTFVSSIFFEEGNVTVYSGSFLDLESVDVAPNLNSTLNITLTQSDFTTPIDFTKSGMGRLNLDGPNYMTGATIVTGGILDVNSQVNLTRGDISVSGGGIIQSPGILEFTNRAITVQGEDSLITSDAFIEVGDAGNGTLHLTSGGDLTAGSSFALGVNGGVSGTATVTGAGSELRSTTHTFMGFYGSGELNVGAGGRVTVGDDLIFATHGSGSGTLNLNPGGTLAIGGTNALRVGAGSATVNLGGGRLEVTGADLTTNLPANLVAGTTSTVDSNGFNATLFGSLSGPGGLAKSGTGTLTLPNANSFTGGTTVNAGTLFLGNASSIGASPANLTLNGGILDLNSFNLAFDTVTLNGGTFKNGNLNNAAAFNLLSAAYTIAGDAQLGIVPESPTPGQLTFNGGTLATTGSFAINPNRGIVLGPSGGTLNVADNTILSYGSTIAGSGSLNKTGAGTLVLNGDNTYSGSTHVSGGALRLGSPNSLYNGDLSQWSKLSFGSGATPILDFSHADFTNSVVARLLNDATYISGTPALELYFPDNHFLNRDVDLSTMPDATLTLSGSTNLYINGQTVALGGATNPLITIARPLGGGTAGATGATGTTGANGNSFSRDGAPGGPGGNGGTGSEAGNLQLTSQSIAIDSLLSLVGGPGGIGGTGGTGGVRYASFNDSGAGGAGGLGGTGGVGGVLTLEGPTATVHMDVKLNGGAGGQGGRGGGNDDGGTGGDGGFGGTGGQGGLLENSVDTLVFHGAVDLLGGNGGSGGQGNTPGNINGTRGYAGSGGSGGRGGDFVHDGNSVSFNQAVNVSGGGGGNASFWNAYRFNVTSPEAGGDGGDGGSFSNRGSLAVFNNSLLLEGGSGGRGNSGITTGVGGNGGNGGSLSFDRATTSFQGFVSTMGGAGGNGGLGGSGYFSASTGADGNNGGNGARGGDFNVTGGVVNFEAGASVLLAGGDGGTGGYGGSGTATSGNGGDGGSGGDSGNFILSGGIARFASDASLELTGGSGGAGGAAGDAGSTAGAPGMAGSAGTLTMTGGLLELSSMGWLEDTSTFVGNFAFNGGTLKTTDSSESITLGSAAVLAGALSNPNSAQARTLDLGGDLAYSGVLAGTGAFTKAGPGDLTLSAAGTVARFHVIDGGRIVSGIDNALNFNSTLTVNESGIFDMAGFDQTLYGVNGTGQILIKSGSLVVGASNGSSLFSGSFSGSGALTKVGNGNFTLTGNSTFTGTTAVTGGSLTIDADSALGTAPAGMTAGHLVLQNSTLITTNSFSLNSNRGISLEGAGGTISPQAGTTLTYGGITDGSGVLVKRGGGTLRLTGNNSHTGGTLIFDGTLLGDTNSLQGSIVNNATLVFDQSSTGVYSAELSGSGSLTKSGAGNLTLTGTNSYSGGTTVAEGTLTGDASSLQGAIVNNTSVVFEQAGAGTYGGGLSGPGSLSKSGPGELILSGANSHTGGTFVSAGTLTVASATNLGNTSGAVSVAAGATLATGNSFASNHSITVNGGSLSNSGDLLVGASAAGSLSLVSGSTASAQNFNVAFNGGSSGDVEIRSGSAVTVGNATTVGWHPSSQGNVLITGANSILSNTGVYYLGWQGDGSTTIADGGELMSTGVRIADAPGSSGILNINTDGTLETAGLSAGSGSATVNFAGGTLRATGSFSSHVPLILSNTSTFDSNGEAVTLSNQISGDGALNKLGSGALTLSGDNTYTGGTTVSDGSVLGDASSLQGDIVNNALLTFEQSAEGTYGNVVSGSGALAKQGEGSLTLTNANLYTGGTTVHTGTLRLGAGGASGSVPGDIINHATLAFHRSDDYTFPGVISGSGAVIHDGSVLRFSAAQSYEGPTQINTGVLVLPFQIDQGLSSLTEVAIGAGAILDISNSSLTVAGLSGGGSVYSFRDSNPSAGHLTINTPTGPSQVFSGVLGSTFPDFAISKTGQGTLTLTGANTYTGATTVNQGRLEFANGLTTAGAGILVTQNGTLAAGQTIARNLQNDANVVAMGESPLSLTGELTGTGQFSGDFLFAGTTRPGNSPGLMTIDGDLEFAANHVFEAEISGFTRGSGYDAVDISGSLHLDGTLRLVLADGLSLTKGNLFNLFAASSYTGEITTLDVSEATLPENLRWDASELNTTGTLKVRGRNFAEWAADFSVAANPNADPLGEGVPLLLKYALGLDPTIRATPGELPDFAHWTDGGQDHLAVSFDPDQGVEGVSIIAEISGDLVNWSEDDVVSVENFTGEELFRDVHPIGEHERRFIRLRFTLEETP